MNQDERRKYMVKYLMDEEPRYGDMQIPKSDREQKNLLRAFVNVRLPKEIDGDFLKIQDKYLAETVKEKGSLR